MVKFYTDLSQYLSLSFEEKLRSKIQAKSAMGVPKNYQDEEIIDIRNLSGSKILVFNNALPNYFIRKSVGQKIIDVSYDFLTKGFYLEIFEMYRDINKQRREFEEIKNIMIQRYPDATDEQIYNYTVEFIADPDVFPPHTTGGAIDVRLLDNEKKIVDMGNEINDPSERSHFYTDNLTDIQMKNRYLLREVFLKHGFAPLATEWWHFSYGDNYWAAFYNKSTLFKPVSIDD